MELNSTKNMQALIQKPNCILDAIAAVSRSLTKVDPSNKRMSINKSQLNSCQIFISRAFNEISNDVFPRVIWVYINNILELLDTMLSSTTQEEFDLTLREPLIDLLKPLLVELKLFAGDWYTTNKFDNTTGDYDSILHSIVETCFNNNKFLGLDKEE